MLLQTPLSCPAPSVPPCAPNPTGTLKPQRPRRACAAGRYAVSVGGAGTSGETLRSRLSSYMSSRARRLGPAGEPPKDAFFQQQLQAGGKLYLRCVVVLIPSREFGRVGGIAPRIGFEGRWGEVSRAFWAAPHAAVCSMLAVRVWNSTQKHMETLAPPCFCRCVCFGLAARAGGVCAAVWSHWRWRPACWPSLITRPTTSTTSDAGP